MRKPRPHPIARALMKNGTIKIIRPSLYRKWSNAVPTEVEGIRFPSKMEARVYARLSSELKPGQELFRQVRFPLLGISPGEKRVPLYLSVDFVIVSNGEHIRVIDAKSRRKSRDWERGKAAFQAFYGVTLEETDQ